MMNTTKSLVGALLALKTFPGNIVRTGIIDTPVEQVLPDITRIPGDKPLGLQVTALFCLFPFGQLDKQFVNIDVAHQQGKDSVVLARGGREGKFQRCLDIPLIARFAGDTDARMLVQVRRQKL